jgi:hypothetical protein
MTPPKPTTTTSGADTGRARPWQPLTPPDPPIIIIAHTSHIGITEPVGPVREASVAEHHTGG